MPRGGYRSGAGRPQNPKQSDGLEESLPEIPAENQTPLEYMLAVMNSPAEDKARRDRMAMAAAPYVHPRAADAEGGKKEKRQAVAEEAASGKSKFAPPAAPKLVVSNKR